MAISLLSHTIAGSANLNNVTTGAISTTGASLLVVIVSESAESPVAAALTDSSSNTWTRLTTQSTGVAVASAIFYVLAPTTSGSHTFTYTHTGFAPSIAVLAFSGVDTAGFDSQSGAIGDGTQTTQQPGSITPTGSSDVFITGIAWGASRTMAIDSSFTITDQIDYLAAGDNLALGAAYKISSVAENPTWSWTTAMTPACVMATFKAASSGGTNPFFVTTADVPPPLPPSSIHRTWTQKAQLVPPSGTPATPPIFPNPAPAKPFHFGYIDYYVEDTSVPFLGNTSTTFPNPNLKGLAPQTWLFTPLGSILQPPAPVPFFGLTDPNPRIYLARTAPTWLVNLLSSTLAPIPPAVTTPVGFVLRVRQAQGLTLNIVQSQHWTTTIQ